MLSVSRRECRIGGKISGALKEQEGKETERTLSIQLEEIMLDEAELNSLFAEPYAHQVLFDTGKVPAEPHLKSLKAFELKDASEGAHCEIFYGLHHELVMFREARLSKIRLEPRVGGLTALSCTVTAAPVFDEVLSGLINHIGSHAEVELRAHAPGAQKDLPLSRHGEGEQPEISSIGRQVQASARKAARKASRAGKETVQ